MTFDQSEVQENCLKSEGNHRKISLKIRGKNNFEILIQPCNGLYLN